MKRKGSDREEEGWESWDYYGEEEGWEYLEQGITKLKRIFEGLPEPCFNLEDYMMLYTTVYNIGRRLPGDEEYPDQQNDKLYDKYKRVLEDYMPSKVLPSLREKHDEYDLLRELLKSWANHKFLVKWLVTNLLHVKKASNFSSLCLALTFFLKERAKALADAVSGEALHFEYLHEFFPEKGMILANASAIGMEPNSDQSPVPQEALKAYELVFDAVYTPRNTRLLREAAEVGASVVSGVEMFIWQALGCFRTVLIVVPKFLQLVLSGIEVIIL